MNNQLKNELFSLSGLAREDLFLDLSKQEQTDFMSSLSLTEQKTFFDTSTDRGKTIAFNALPVDGRNAYLNTLNKVELNDFTEKLRAKAVELFWTNERELIKKGLGTQDWTPEQMEAILNLGVSGDEGKTGKAALVFNDNGELVLTSKGNGDVYRGHHMLNVKGYPAYAGDPANIQPLIKTDHLAAHNGNTKNPTNWYYDPVTKEKIVIDLSSPDPDCQEIRPSKQIL